MPLRQFIGSDVAFQPHEVAAMAAAFEEALRELGLTDRTDKMTEMVAREIIDLAKRGERNPATLRAEVIKKFRDGSGDTRTSRG